ncbi:hypothetical protein MN202_02755 [Rheinheimera muenzenbergensis]|uniref:Uncharacterized protein n=1 Tax=Rheinheimera muenzenbergensis TaxID=1193628 RepID=A0ABU8C2L8_9GAMM
MIQRLRLVVQHQLKIIGELVLLLLIGIMSYLLISIVLYRLPDFNQSIKIESEIVFDFVDINISNRDFIETIILGNSVVSIVEGGQRFFVSKEDKKRLWAVSPHELKKRGVTLNVTLEVQPLLFGGYGRAHLIAVQEVNSEPRLTK